MNTITAKNIKALSFLQIETDYSNIKDIMLFCNLDKDAIEEAFAFFDGGDVFIFADLNGNEIVIGDSINVKPGDYLVRDESQGVFVVPCGLFKQLFYTGHSFTNTVKSTPETHDYKIEGAEFTLSFDNAHPSPVRLDIDKRYKVTVSTDVEHNTGDIVSMFVGTPCIVDDRSVIEVDGAFILDKKNQLRTGVQHLILIKEC